MQLLVIYNIIINYRNKCIYVILENHQNKSDKSDEFGE
jgi:hypothetical protein